MSRLCTISDGDMTEFKRLLGEHISAEDARKLMKRPEVMTVIEKAMREHPFFRLIHGVFNPATDILESFKAQCTAKGIDFTKFSWVTPETALDFTDDEEVVVVLDATLDTLQNTFEFAWGWTVEGQEDKWRYEGMVSDSKKLRLLSDDREDDAEGDGADFKPWTLAWRRIKLNANIGKKPCDIRDAKTSPGCALLFVAAEHPERIKATDYQKRFGFWLPGLKCTAPGERQWRLVPYVHFDRDDRQVGLYSFWHDISYGDLAVPVPWE